MVKKFKDFINEGFLSKTINRAKTGEERLENSFWTDESMFQVEGFKDYYISPDPEGYFIDVYHKPNKEPLLSFKDLDMCKTYYALSPWSEIENESKDLTPEDEKIISSVKFKNAINQTIEDNVPEEYYDLGDW